MKGWFSKEDILKEKNEYLDAIDTYTEYIDSAKQYEYACRRNNRLSKLASFCDDLVKAIDNIELELKSKGFNGKIEYRKGYFRLYYNGRYLYRKCNVVYTK